MAKVKIIVEDTFNVDVEGKTAMDILKEINNLDIGIKASAPFKATLIINDGEHELDCTQEFKDL